MPEASGARAGGASGTGQAGPHDRRADEPATDRSQEGVGLEIGSSGVAPVIEQAAILYANGQVQGAADVLAQAIRADQLGGATSQAWLMLLDLHQYLGHQDAFEALAVDYAARFERSPPTWREEEVARPAVGDRSASRAGIVLPAAIDAGVSRQIDAIDRAVQRDRDLAIDCRGVRMVDAAGGALLDAALGRIERGAQQVAFIAPERLLEAARAAVQTGRRDPDAGAWLLLLRLLRLAGTQQAFEDASIDYCVTYEVSPPSWEPMPAHVHRDEGGLAGAGEALTVSSAAAPAGPTPRADAFVLAGDLIGAMDADMAALRAHAERHAHVFIDCRRLRRLDFAAAGQLLNTAAGLRAAGRTVELDQPSHVVAALLTVMGLLEVATITPRKP